MPSNTWDRIEDIFSQAIDMPEREQAAFLAHACGGDERLRGEILSLLDADVKNGEKITRAVEDEAQNLFGFNAIIGSRLGAYRVIREIGHGGMGAVYLAVRDDEQFHKNVAIKLIKRGMDTAEVLSRFQRERQILAGLDHTCIARLIDAGTTDDGRPFFVMEYVEGESIDNYCRARGLAPADICRLFLKVCDAVSHAHRNLVVHRDLKPRNIFVAPNGDPKLLDFGVAKLLAAGSSASLTITGMHSLLLTPEYASPEQVMGRPVNTATDVYSLGGVLYELLTGSCAQTLETGSPEEIREVVCLREVASPSALKPDVPIDLDNIVMMAMRKDSARRYQSVAQFAEDIRRFLDGRPVRARKDSIAYRAGKFARRNRIVLAGSALVLASLIGGIVIAMSQARRAENRLQEMVELANRSLFDVHTAIERLPGSTEARRSIIKTTLEFLQHLSTDAGRDDRLRLPLAAAYFRLGDLQGYQFKPNLGDSRGALDSYGRAAALIEPLLRKRPNDPDTLRLYAEIYDRVGTIDGGVSLNDIAASVKGFQTALPAASTLARLRPEDKQANQQLGAIYSDLSQALQLADPDTAYRYARLHLDLVAALLKKLPGDDDIVDEAADAHATACNILARRHDLKSALAEARESVALREQAAAAHPNDTVRLRGLMLGYGHVGDVLFMDRAPAAFDYFDKCVEIARRISRADPQDRTAQYDLASALMRQGAIENPASQIPKTLAPLRESIAIFDSLTRADPAVRYPRGLLLAYARYGFHLKELGKPDEALAQLERSISVSEEIFAQYPGDVAPLPYFPRVEGEAAAILVAHGDTASALAHVRHSLSTTQKYADGPERGLRQCYVGASFFYLGNIQRMLGKWDEARASAQQALSILNAPGMPDSAPREREAATLLIAEVNSHLNASAK